MRPRGARLDNATHVSAAQDLGSDITFHSKGAAGSGCSFISDSRQLDRKEGKHVSTAGFFVSHATYDEFDVPDSTNTQALGVNVDEEIVGSYVDARGLTHGFVLTDPTTHASFKTVDDPAGVGSTVINDVNDKGQLVSFYQDSAKNTVGFFATPRAKRARRSGRDVRGARRRGGERAARPERTLRPRCTNASG